MKNECSKKYVDTFKRLFIIRISPTFSNSSKAQLSVSKRNFEI